MLFERGFSFFLKVLKSFSTVSHALLFSVFVVGIITVVIVVVIHYL